MKSILIAPVITEKSMREASMGRFTFVVAKDSTKSEIGHAVKEAFKVDAVKIQTLIVPSKEKRIFRKREKAVASAWKKAIITVKSGQKIDLFDVVEDPSVHDHSHHNHNHA